LKRTGDRRLGDTGRLTRESAYKTFDRCVKRFDAKCTKTTECLVTDRNAMLVFYDFPAVHLPMDDNLAYHVPVPQNGLLACSASRDGGEQT